MRDRCSLIVWSVSLNDTSGHLWPFNIFTLFHIAMHFYINNLRYSKVSGGLVSVGFNDNKIRTFLNFHYVLNLCEANAPQVVGVF